jgi:hypothetical protein
MPGPLIIGEVGAGGAGGNVQVLLTSHPSVILRDSRNRTATPFHFHRDQALELAKLLMQASEEEPPRPEIGELLVSPKPDGPVEPIHR